MKRLQREAIAIILALSVLYIYDHIMRSVAEYWSKPVLLVIVLCAYILYRITLSILKLERDEFVIILVFLLMVAYRFSPYISERLFGHENLLILILCVMLAYIVHRYIEWIFTFMGSQTSGSLGGMGNISLLECLWPPLYQRRLNRRIRAEIDAEIAAEREAKHEDKANKSDESIIDKRTNNGMET